MIDLNSLSKSIIKDRMGRRWVSSTRMMDALLPKITLGLAKEVGEFESRRKVNNKPEMMNALIDIMIYCLDGLGILDADIEKELIVVYEANKT